MCKQISSNLFKNVITYKSYMYIHLIVYKQMINSK